ncbi:MAG: Asp-tRNA(Asn)/Glu-tRNA(Gln) amidotransferase subunit GatC [Candidatus Omnitrophica bacterium]|nr:Asp-tRNA(Asn)/Glu-tRNA(Gln) amidotransferase subunit GatC [Candidatus Omnitrophota bacterium]MCK5260498.1 Asp-tRNA(Asn)/Glu-tRNA(Gln) amidotransferase subunit GatC [Candidatus Omnitrophota bacterium]
MISEKDVQYVAGLARIHLKDEEAGRLTKDLEKILDYINKLDTLDVADVQPTSHVLPLKNVYREDKVRPSLTQQEALKISVEQHEGSFKVPKVIE